MKTDLRPLGFLFDLVCQAPEAELRVSWLALRDAGLLGELRGLAGRFGLVSALARFAARLPAEDVDTDARRAVAQGMAAQHGVSSVIRLLTRLFSTPELLGREAIAIKGTALVLDGLYEDERDLCDADVLVRESDLDTWRAAAERIGATYKVIGGGAHEFAAITSPDALVELHAALPATVGFERGPGYDSVRRHARPPRRLPRPPGLLVVADEAAIEVAVHHFAFHHGGLPTHALRTLQDLRAIDAAPGAADLLPWGNPSPRAAVTRLAALARTYASDGDPDLGARFEFLANLATVQDFPESSETIFTDSVRRWLSLSAPGGPSKWERIVGRLIPQKGRGQPPDSRLAALVGVFRRLASLSTKYAAGLLMAKKSRAPFSALESWRSFLYGPSK